MSELKVGIIGAGQLGRMMALAGYPLGIECRFVDTEARSPAGQVAPITVAEIDDAPALREMAQSVDVVSFDIENVSVAALQALESVCPVRPGPGIVALAQDRLAEKQLFESLDIPTAPYAVIDSPDHFEAAGDRLGWPVVLKARRLGYDGRGQRIAHSREQLAAAWNELGGIPSIAEGWVDFSREVSLIGVRGAGESRFYPLTENRHRDGMLESSVAPFEDPGLQAQAESWMAGMMARHDYRGVLTIEFFLTSSGLIANEIAPRVHNSGHWTIEGAETSQFENHLRAILGLPLGSTRCTGVAAMRNLIGRIPPAHHLLAIEGLHLHDYGKSPRPQRKLGHCTLVDRDRKSALARLDVVSRLLEDLGE